MRGGGPKLLCSPYFSIGAVLILLVITIKFFSLKSEHDDLLLKVSVLQNQMKLTASNMRNLDTSLTRKEEAFNECNEEKNALMEKNKLLERDLNQKEDDLKNLQEINDEGTVLVQKLKSNIEKFSSDNQTLLEEVKYLRRRNEELGRNDEECQANRAKVNQLQGELNSIKEIQLMEHEKKKVFIQNEQKVERLPQGELQDVNPGAVHIRQPALNGTSAVGHNQPILPHQPPDAIKAKPTLVWELPVHNDDAVRKAIIEDEENKVQEENRQFPLEDEDKPKLQLNQIHESFLEKKAKYDQRPVTETFLNLNLLKRQNFENEEDENETETAVLKKPMNLAIGINQNETKIDEVKEVIEDNEQYFPNDKEQRDPEVLLHQDPQARDQDNDFRISEAIEDFAQKNKAHNWRNNNA